MSTQKNLYSVDTSALIDGLERHYPEGSFPALWANVDRLVAAGRFFISEEVWEEVQARDAVAKAWCGPRRDSLVIPTDAPVAKEVQRILVNHSQLVKSLKNRNRADPFVIAVASLRGGIVVTGEGSDGTQNKPKIPYVCQQLGVPYLRFLDMIKHEGWKF